jgi:hypothetical protein
MDQQLLDLTIVAKTELGNGFCYIGFSHKHNRLFRPIYGPERKYCNWLQDEEMDIGDRCQFKVISMPPNQNHPRLKLPHLNDDVLVDKTFIKGDKAFLPNTVHWNFFFRKRFFLLKKKYFFFDTDFLFSWLRD